MFDRIINFAQFPLGTPSDAFEADIEPFILFVSGPVSLPAAATDFFSTAWIFGQDETDFFKNRRTVQNIYNADYNFAQPPFSPTLTAIAGDKRVVLTWDTVSVASFDRFSQEFDFEGYKLYKGTDPLLSGSRTITNIDGTPTFFKPIGHWDLENEIVGPVTVLDGEGVYNLGSDSGLSFFYIDDDVTNGIDYYYALVAYDRGVIDEQTGELSIDPQENIFNISVDLSGRILGISNNAAVVVPRSRPAGYIDGDVNEDLSVVTSGTGSGSLFVRVVDDTALQTDRPYQVRLYSQDDDTEGTDLEVTTEYDIVDVSTGTTLVNKTDLVPVSPMVDGFVVELNNLEAQPGVILYHDEKTGYVANPGTSNELFRLDPRELDGYTSNWIASVRQDESSSFVQSQDDYELVWVNPNDSTYTPPRFGFTFLRVPLPFFAVNASTGAVVDMFIEDTNKNKEFDVEDVIIIAEAAGFSNKFRHKISFALPEGDGVSTPPTDGNRLRVSVLREFQTGDYFQFTLKKAFVDVELAGNELADIGVVPNPYIGGSQFEKRSQISGRGERQIEFINLPQECTISIFNVRGELIDTIEHSDFGSDGSASWDLQTAEGQDVAYGVYIYHVKADGIGEHVGKFALVK